MLTRQLALTTETKQIQLSDLLLVSAAIQKQVTRDFSPLWGISATVDAFASPDQVPLGYWRISLVDEVLPDGELGFHQDDLGQPYAKVRADNEAWPLAVSHESLEMLVDPSGQYLVPGPSPSDGKRVEFLVEACDPCESADFAYKVNGIVLSDFYTPRYFDPVGQAGVRYDFTGGISQPRQVLRGGYLTWYEPISNGWYQERFFGAAPEFVPLPPVAAGADSLRTAIDSLVAQSRGGRTSRHIHSIVDPAVELAAKSTAARRK